MPSVDAGIILYNDDWMVQMKGFAGEPGHVEACNEKRLKGNNL